MSSGARSSNVSPVPTTTAIDWTAGAPQQQELSWRPLIRHATLFIVLAAMTWLTAYGLFHRYPYVRSGADIVVEKKREAAGTHLLGAPAPTHVVTFGNSRVLAGFRPDVFDVAYGSEAKSFNMGLPGEMRFADVLERMLEAGDRPTHVLTQFSPMASHESWLVLLRDSKYLIDRIVPFRDLPRDLLLFLSAARAHGGAKQYYLENEQQILGMFSDRGWFFIRSQSHFPGDRLPMDYRLPTDDASKPPVLFPFTTDTPAFRKLTALAEKYDFKIVRIPVAFREGECSAPSPAPAFVEHSKHFLTVGPEYVQFPPSDFSDPVHLNPGGAERYTKDLAQLLRTAEQAVN